MVRVKLAAVMLAVLLVCGITGVQAFADSPQGGASRASDASPASGGVVSLAAGSSDLADDAAEQAADEGADDAEAAVDAEEKAAKRKAARERAAERKAEREQAAKLKRKVLDEGLYNIGSASKTSLSLAPAGDSKRVGANVGAEARDMANWSQKWILTWNEKRGYYKIRNLSSRKFLTVSGKAKSGAKLVQKASSKSESQLWEPVKKAGKVAFKCAGSNHVLSLTDKGASPALVLKSYAGKSKLSASQLFRMRTAEALETDRTYYVSNVASGKRLHVQGDSVKRGARIELAGASASKGQKFRLKKYGSGYRLQNVRSTWSMGVGASKKVVRQQSGLTGASGKWAVELDLASGRFTITSKLAGKRLDGASGSLALRKASGSAGQLFSFTPTYAFKLYLNPGHGANDYGFGGWDTGAVGNGHTEAEFTHDLARRVERLLAGSDVKVVNGEPFELPYWERLPKAVSLGCDAIVSLHFDAGAGSGTLKMAGVQAKAPGSEAMGDIIHREIVSAIGLVDRGWSYRSDITCVNGSIPSYLTEVCFMDNAGDVQRYLERRDAVARAIAKGILKATRSPSLMHHVKA